MTLIKVFNLILLLINLKCVLNTQLNGKCGYPGKPYRASLEPDNKVQYNEGEEVIYQCNDYWFQPQSRKCERGRWTGKPARCADFVRDVLMRDLTVEDISTPEKPIKILEYLNLNLTAATWKYPNAYSTTRYPKLFRVFGTKRHRWTLKFTVPNVKLFVKININFINYTHLSVEEKQNFTFNLKMFVSPQRKCVLDFQNEEKWKDNGGKINNFISCDSLSSEAHKRDIENPGDYLIMETKSNVQLHQELLAVIFGKSYGSPKEPLCGEPELSVSHNSRFKQQYRDYSIECKNDKNWRKNNLEYERKCVGDMRWSGSYPQCLPIKTCPLDELLTNSDSNKTIINSLDDLYFYNRSTYYAIEGTQVQYGCANPTDHILVGKDNRVCDVNGKWSDAQPYCYDQNVNRKSPIVLVIVILVGTLTLVIILIAILFCIHTKRIKNKITKQIAIQKNTGDNCYDDIGVYSGEKDYSYDPLREEVRYADPYYTSGQYYDRVEVNDQYQSKDEQSTQSNSHSNYIAQAIQPKPVPRTSVKHKNPDIYYNVS